MIRAMRMTLPILAALLALQTGAALATTRKAAPAPAQFKVLKAEFGIIGPGGFQPSAKVPLKDGQSFGWVIRLDTKTDIIKWREEIRLPAAPQTWQADETSGKHTLSADRRTSTLEREAKIEDGLIYNFWQISPGDPKGRYTMRVMIEGLLVSNFAFDVE
jgi:hypothetical protein